MEIWYWPLIVVVGSIAGFINTLAGGGSLLTLPLLIFVGLPANVANGTNRVAIFAQNLSALVSFRKNGVSGYQFGKHLILPALFGALIGSFFAVKIEEHVFKQILSIVLVFALIPIFYKPSINPIPFSSQTSYWLSILAFFFIGIYGGFIQAGVGFIIISALVGIKGFDLVQTNATKVFVVFFYTTITLLVFGMGNKIDWQVGTVLAIGNSLGAWLGGYWATKYDEKWIRRILAVMVVASAIKLAFW